MLIRTLKYCIYFFLVVAHTLCMGSQLTPIKHDHAEQNHSLDFRVNLLASSDEQYDVIDRYLSAPIYVDEVKFSSDITCDMDDIALLMQLKNGIYLTAEILKNGCSVLKLKNKFESVHFVLTSKDTKHMLKVELKSIWTFNRVSCEGPIVEKEKYEQCYTVGYAENFDLQKHEHGLKKIEQALKNDGYLNVTLKDYVAYDKSRKSVSVVVSIDNANRFTISDVTCNVVFSENNNNAQDVQEKIVRKFLHPLRKSASVKSEIRSCTTQIKEYLLQKGYIKPKIAIESTIDTQKETVMLHVTITLGKQQRFIFLGNHFFSNQELFKELCIFGDATFIIPASLLMEDLILLYRKKGFKSVTVSYREENNTFYFIINEGPRSKLAGVTVKEIADTKSDNSQNFQVLISAENIQKAFELAITHAYDEQIIKKCITKLIEEYYQLGYWSAQAVDENYKILEHTEAVELYTLELTIKTGIKRMLKEIIFKGHEYLAQEEPFKSWASLEHPRPFSLQSIAEQRNALISYFKKKGMVYAKIAPSIKETAEGDILTWQFEATSKCFFGKTVIQGDNTVASRSILRELVYREGDEFDKDKIQQSLARLKKLGIFKSLSLVQDAQQASETDTSKTMILKCVEDNPFEIRTRFGLQQISKNFTYTPLTTFKIGGSLLWKNPTGCADIIALDADITRYSRNTSLQYTLPWLGNLAITTQYKLFSEAFEQPLLGRSSHLLYKASYDGFSIKSTHQYDFIQSELLASLQAIKISGLSTDLARLIKFEPALVDVRNPYLVIEPSIIIDNLDNKVDARYGTFTALSCKGMFSPKVAAGSFLRVLGEQSFFYPLYGDCIGALRVRLGHIFCSKFTTLLPSERFYLGGSNSLRGYEPSMVPPLNACTNKNETFWVPVGGKSMVNINAEIRFPMYSQFDGVLFNDMGVLSQEGFTVLPNNWLGATGFGFRYKTPIGPIRFDIGWKWHKREATERRYAWFLTFGHAF